MAVAQGYVDAETHEALTFGKAVHKYAERRSLGDDHIAAYTRALETYQGPNHAQLSNTCSTMPIQSLPVYIDASGHIYAEHKFKIFWKSIIYNGTQYNIWVVGTLDLVTLFSHGVLRINDYKTTRKWKAAEVFASYAASVQMMFYVWAARKFAHHIFDITAGNIAHMGHIFMQITAIFIGKTPVIWQAGSPIQYSMDQLNAFEETLNHHITHNIIPAWAHPQKTGMVNDTCDGCPFTEHCFAATPEAAASALHRMKQQKYDPTTW